LTDLIVNSVEGLNIGLFAGDYFDKSEVPLPFRMKSSRHRMYFNKYWTMIRYEMSREIFFG
jgi:hypothetical protein